MSDWPRRFVGSVARGQTWLNLGYNLLAFPTGLAYFVVLVVGVSLGVGLAIVIIGLGILLATLAAWRAMAALERGLARGLLGVRSRSLPTGATCRWWSACSATCATR